MYRSVRMRWGWVLLIVIGLAAAGGWALAQEQSGTDAGNAATGTAEGAGSMDQTGEAGAGTTGVDSGTMPQEQAAPPAPAASQPAAKAQSGLVEYFNKGGKFMWPLLLSSIVGLAAIIERGITLRRASTNTKRFIARIVEELRQNGIRAAIETCQRTRGPIAAIIHSGLTKADQGPEAVEKAIEAAGGIEVSFLQRGLIVMASVANIAPLLGFLGTVSGMIGAFEAIAAADQVSAKLVASGISEALITTQTGLVIAIPVQMFYNYYVSRIDRFIVEMEESSLDLINELEAGNIKGM